MIGIIILLLIVGVLVAIGIHKHGWKGFTVAMSALAAGLYAGGQQMIDALKVFIGG
jgi:hypothetical protein